MKQAGFAFFSLCGTGCGGKRGEGASLRLWAVRAVSGMTRGVLAVCLSVRRNN